MEKLSSVAATVMNSKIYVIRSYRECERHLGWVNKPAVVHCFGPKYNVWTKLASTCHPHFKSSLFVVNNKLCVAGEILMTIVTVHLWKCMMKVLTPLLQCIRNIFPQTTWVQLKQRGGCISSSTISSRRWDQNSTRGNVSS